MKTFPIIIKGVYVFIIFGLVSCSKDLEPKPNPDPDPKDPEISEPFSRGRGNITYNQYTPLSNKPVELWYYNPVDDPSSLPIVFVCHGASRNGKDYRDIWIEHAVKYKLLIVAPEFSDQYYPGSAQYNLGNMFKNEEAVNEEYWTYSIIEPIFDYVVETIEGTQTSYDIFGHSAGAQFVHRLATFKGEIRANLLIAANAGWYTMPDTSIAFPYGLKGSTASFVDIKRLSEKDIIILLGDADTLRTSNLRQTPEADAQGFNRFERGHTYFYTMEQQSDSLNTPFLWQLDTVPGVGHSSSGMAKDISEKIYGEGP